MADPVEPKVEKAVTENDINKDLVLPGVNVRKGKSSEKVSEESQTVATEQELEETNFSFAVKKDTSAEQETDPDLQLGQASLETYEDFKKSYSGFTAEETSPSTGQEEPVLTILDRLISFIADKLKDLERYIFGKEKIPAPESTPQNQITAKQQDRTKKKKTKGLSPLTEEEEEEEEEEEIKKE